VAGTVAAGSVVAGTAAAGLVGVEEEVVANIPDQTCNCQLPRKSRPTRGKRPR
jgi:hypothetical protein